MKLLTFIETSWEMKKYNGDIRIRFEKPFEKITVNILYFISAVVLKEPKKDIIKLPPRNLFGFNFVDADMN